MDIKLSIIFTVYNSHEAVRRQLIYFKSLNLPDDIEIIIMDDGSNPPLELPKDCPNNTFIFKTGIITPWSQALARNMSIEKARGGMLLMTDIDHFFPIETIMAAKDFDGDKMMFKRQWGILDKKGVFHQNKEILTKYGLSRRKRRKNFFTYCHHNSFAIKKSVYQALNGYKSRYWKNRFHRSGDSDFYKRYLKASLKGIFKPAVRDHLIYVFPAANANKLGLFHNLSRQDDPILEDKPCQ